MRATGLRPLCRKNKTMRQFKLPALYGARTVIWYRQRHFVPSPTGFGRVKVISALGNGRPKRHYFTTQGPESRREGWMRTSSPLLDFSHTPPLSCVKFSHIACRSSSRKIQRTATVRAPPPDALVVLTAAPSHRFRSRGGPRESLEPGHEFGLARDAVRGRGTMVSNFCVRECAIAESADAQPGALAAAAAVRVLMMFAGSVAVSSCSTAVRPLLSSEPPVWSRFRTISHTSSDPLWSGKRRKRDQTGGSDERRAADDHSRCFADPAKHG